MASLFFYGTLRHRLLLERVLGRTDLRISEARLPDRAVRRAAGKGSPQIVEAPGQAAEGLLCEGCEAADLARIDFYEGGHGHAPRMVEVFADGRAVAARAYFPPAGGAVPGAPWSREGWAEKWAPLALRSAEEAMSHFGRMSIEDLRRWLPRMRARAWSAILAQEGRPATTPGTPTAADVTTHRIERRHSGFFALDEYRLSHSRFGGGRTEKLVREAFISSDAALVLPYDATSDRLVLIEQFRMGPTARRDPAPWLFEPIAGLVDPGEAPEDTARREALEEAGLEIGRLELIGRVYASPGNATEFFHCYLGHCRLGADERWTGGIAEEGEDIRSHLMPFERAMALLESGEMNVAPLALMLLWLALHRDRLRASA